MHIGENNAGFSYFVNGKLLGEVLMRKDVET